MILYWTAIDMIKILFRVKQVGNFEAIVHTRNNHNQLLQDVLKHSNHSWAWETTVSHSFDKVYAYTVKHGLLDLNKTLFDYVKQIQFHLGSLRHLECVTSAIMYNRQEILEMILDYVTTTEDETYRFNEFSEGFSKLFKVLRRSECAIRLSKCGVLHDKNDPTHEYETILLLNVLICSVRRMLQH